MQPFWPLSVSMPCQAGEAEQKLETETKFQVFSKSILTIIVLEKSCKIPYVDPATVSYT